MKRRKNSYIFDKVFFGKGIDVGCGWDVLNKDKTFPNITSCEPFDIEQGDAQYVNKLRKESNYDFVHSSNCLEHMNDPLLALKICMNKVISPLNLIKNTNILLQFIRRSLGVQSPLT